MATTEVERLVVRLMGDNFAYLAMLKSGTAATTKFAVTAIAQFKAVGTAVVAMGTKIKAVGSAMAMYITAPLMLIAATSTMAFAHFDQAMIESTSIMKVTTAQAEQMRQTALALATDGRVPQGPKELAKAYFYLASAGFTAEQSMKALPQVAAFATAGAFDMSVATSLAADAQSALGLKAADAAENLVGLTRVTDVLVRANTLANANVEQFSTALTSKAGAALKSYKKSIEEGVAVLAAFADQGIKSQLAGNNLSRIMLLLSKAANNNQAALKKYKISVFDTTGTMRNFADIVQDMEVAFSTLSDQERSAALEAMGFAARVQGALLPLIGTSSEIRRYQKELENATGYTKDVAEKQMKSFSNQMKVVKNRVIEMGISIGETLAPMIKSVGERIDVWTKKWKELSPEVKQTIVQMSLWAMAAGPILIIVGKLVSLFGMLVLGVVGVVSALKGAMAVIVAIFSPIGLLVATLAAVLYYSGAGGKMLEWFGKQWEGLSTSMQPAIEGIKNALSSGDIKLAMQIGWKQIEITWLEGIQPLQEAWDALINAILKAWEALPSKMEQTADILRDLFRGIAEPIAKVGPKVGPYIRESWAVGSPKQIPEAERQKLLEEESRRNEKMVTAMFDAWEEGRDEFAKVTPEILQKAARAASVERGYSKLEGDPVFVQKAKAAAVARRVIQAGIEFDTKRHKDVMEGLDKAAADKMADRAFELLSLKTEQAARIKQAEEGAKDAIKGWRAEKPPEIPDFKAPKIEVPEMDDPAGLLGFDEPVAIKVKPELVPAMEWGSQEMMVAMQEYLRGAAPKIKTELSVTGAPKAIADVKEVEKVATEAEKAAAEAKKVAMELAVLATPGIGELTSSHGRRGAAKKAKDLAQAGKDLGFLMSMMEPGRAERPKERRELGLLGALDLPTNVTTPLPEVFGDIPVPGAVIAKLGDEEKRQESLLTEIRKTLDATLANDKARPVLQVVPFGEHAGG